MAIQNILPDLTHIARTTYQWEHTADKYEIIPNGVLCIEFVAVDQTLIKIGDGHHIYKQLPYVSSIELKNYYTKEETDNRIIEIFNELKSIRIKGEVSDLSHLPTDNNTEGDLWFVRRTSPSGHSRYDEYVWYKNNWESIGLSESDIDLSEYAKKEYVDEKIEEVDEKIDRYMHTHSNKEILDQITAPFTTEKDEKLESLHNYDDTEIRRIIDERTHTHSNKNILDQTSAAYTTDKDNKLASLENYDDTAVQDRLTLLERIAHFHENQEILNRTTAAFTREQAITLLDCKDFEGTDGTNDGYHGFVPAPTKNDVGKVLGANGQWVPMSGGGGGDTVTEGGGISITTDAQTGNKVISVNAGTGLDIDQQTGELYVTATGGDSIAEGSGIDITTDSQTGVKTISVDIGDGLQFNQNSEIEVNTGDGLLINQDNELELDKATKNSIGGVIVGDNIDVSNGTISVPIATDSSLGVVNPTDGLSIDNTGELSVNTGDGLSINQDNEIEINIGEGLSINQDNELEVNVGDGLSINASDEVELDKATTSAIGGVIVGDNIDVNNGTISVPKAASNKLGVIKPSDGLSIDSNGVLTVDTGDGLSIDSTTKEVNVNTGRALTINQNNDIDVNIASNSAYGCVKIGEGIDVDQYGVISVDKMVPFRTGDGLELVDESVRLPSAYARVEYVENTVGGGWALINSLVPRDVGTSSDKSHIIARLSKTAYSSSSTITYAFGRWDNYNARVKFAFGYHGTSLPLTVGYVYGRDASWNNIDVNGGRVTNYELNDIIDVDLSAAGLKIDNELIHTVSYEGPGSIGLKFGVFRPNTSGTPESGGVADFRGRIYSLKLYDDQVLIFNLVPCVQKSSSIVGFYDSVGDTFYPSVGDNPFETDMSTMDIDVADWVMNVTPATTDTIGGVKVGSGLSVANDGTLSVNTGDGLTVDANNNLKAKIGVGLHFNEENAIEADEIDIDTYEPGNGISFIRHYARELPTGYTQLEYIESHFDAGFILDYYPQKTSKIVCEAAFVDVNRSTPSDNCLFGSRNGNSSSSKQFVLWFNNKTSDPCYVGFVYSGNSWGDVGEHYTYANMYQRLLFEISPSIGVYCNNVLIQNPLSHPDYDPSPYKLGILCLATSDTGIDTTRNYQSGRIFTFKIYESDTLVVDLVPCLNDSDVPGLYDMVSEVFYPSASGTDFAYDPDAVVTHDSITIDANRGPGIIYDNNALSLNPGAGLSIDVTDNQKLNVNLADGLSIKNTSTNAIKINTGDGLSIDSTTNKLNVNIGDGLVKDSSNNIDVNLYENEFYIDSENNQIRINPLYAPTYEAGNGVQFVSTSPYSLPPNYTKLSCVESKNTSSDKSAFRLNYVPTTETKFDVLFGITKTSFSDVTIIGSGGSNTAKYSLNITRSTAATNNTTVRFNYCQDNSSTSVSFTTAIGDILHIVADKNGVYVNNNLVQTPIQTGSPSAYKLCVGSSPATNSAGSFGDPSTPGKYYDIKIYEGNTLTVHLIPCLNDSNVPGMYDEVNELFHHNEWKTDFHYDENEKTRPGYYVQAKLGNGLQFDANNAIEVVNGGTEYTAGDGIKFTNLSQANKIKLVISTIRSTSQSGANAPYTQMRYIEFYDENLDPITIASGEAIWSDGTTVVYSEQIYSLNEMLSNTNKMCVCDYKPSLVLTFTLSSAMSAENIKYFRYKTGNDVPERDPVSWKIYVNDVNAQTSWTQISEAVSETITTSRDTWTQYFTCEFTAGGTTSISVRPATASTLGGVIVGNGLTVTSDGTISTATGKAYIAGEGINMSSSQYEFSAENEQYLFKSKVTCELHGSFNREFQKTTDDTALGIIWNVYDSGTLWSGPIFVGLSSDAVKYTTNSTTYSALGTFSYLGKTWYYSDHSMYVSNIDGTDYDGNMVVDTETYASTSELVDFCKSLIDRARVILKVDEISLLPATEDTLGGIKIGEGLSIDENNVVSSTVYEEGQGIIFETSGSTDSFNVKNKEYYFEDEAKCEITGNFGPRAYWRVYTDDPCLAVIFYRSDNTTAPIYIGLTENSVKIHQSWDGNVLGPDGTFDYKGYSWYYTFTYGLYYSSGVDQQGNLQTITGTSSDDIEDVAKHVIDLAELISPGIKTYDVWNTGTGWLNGAYGSGTDNTFYTNWYKEYHSNNTVYFELPKGATHVKLTGISTSDTVFGGNHIDLFNDSKHHIGTFIGESEWHELLTGTVYLQFGVKWSENNDRNISASDIKSVTLEIKVPKNNAITAKLGDGLTFDEDDAITLDESIKLIIHCVGDPLT